MALVWPCGQFLSDSHPRRVEQISNHFSRVEVRERRTRAHVAPPLAAPVGVNHNPHVDRHSAQISIAVVRVGTSLGPPPHRSLTRPSHGSVGAGVTIEVRRRPVSPAAVGELLGGLGVGHVMAVRSFRRLWTEQMSRHSLGAAC
jgi:hypothetical protein